MLSSGFAAAPVSRALLFFIVASALFVSITDNKHYFGILVDVHLWKYKQVWRMVSWVACYNNSTEVLFAAVLLYHLRVIERLWGSRKFASFLILTLPYTTLLPPLILTLFLRPLSFHTLNYLPSGPTSILFALLAQYHATIPSRYSFRIGTSSSSSSNTSPTATQTTSDATQSLTLTLSDKWPTYLLASQLALSQVPDSILPAAVGWIIGYAWRSELLPLSTSTLRVPAWFVGDDVKGADSASTPSSGVRSGRGSEDGGSAATGLGREGYEGLRRRMEGEMGVNRGGASGAGDTEDDAARRPMARQVLDRFRGAF